MTGHGVSVVEVAAEDGQRLDNFLLARLKSVPKSRVYRMLRRGEVRVNGGRAKPGYRVRRGDRVRIPPHRGGSERPAESPPRSAAQELRGRVLFEDDDVLVLDKPSGIAAHGGSGVAFGVIETLRAAAVDAGGSRPGAYYELAHRLDRDTSGCLAVARNRPTLRRLHAQFRAGRVGKRYDLVVAGQWPARLRTVAKPLLRYTMANGERRVRVAADGDPARTDFEVVERLGDATWLAAFPKTGRTHQIRVHAAACGHPVLGDDKYAPGEHRGHARLMLHASELSFALRDQPVRFTAPIPAAFAAMGPTPG